MGAPTLLAQPGFIAISLTLIALAISGGLPGRSSGVSLSGAEHTTAPDQAINPQFDKRARVNALFTQFAARNAPGGVGAVIQNGEVIFEAAYGLADIEKRTPLTTKHLFHIGSLGKQFTALGILMLVEQGRLNLDEPIGKALPELARFGPRLTIRHLLHHTSGIPDYYADREVHRRLLDRASMPINRDLLAVLSKFGKPHFSPGNKFEYSNAGYDTLGSVIERISGLSYGDYMDRHIFRPVGMNGTFSLPSPRRANNPRIPHSYTRDDGKLEARDTDPLDHLVGSGSFYTTLADMFLYDRALYTNKLIPQSRLTLAFKPAVLNNGEEYLYGFGWELGTRFRRRFTAHDGEWLGFTSAYVRFPDQHFSVVVLLNRDYGVDAAELAFEIAGIYLQH
jgi:CubicO group peptidase (beta-lactamase class C family)